MVLFKTSYDQNNTSKRTRLHQSFQNYHVPEPHSISVADIIIYIIKYSSMKTSSDVVRQTRKFYAQTKMLLRNFRYAPMM